MAWGSVQNAFANMYAANKKKTQAAQPTYAEAPAYMDTAKGMLQGPAAIAAPQQIDVTKMPEYGAATAKTTLDPQVYSNLWNTAEGDINKSYMKKGGYYDRMMEGMNERGLANSGEANFQTRETGNNLATELAKARQGIETQRMQDQSGLDESFANRMGSMLGLNTSTQAGNRDASMNANQFNSNMGWNVAQGQAGLAGQLAGARNQLIGGDADRAAAEATAKTGFETQQWSDLMNILGQADLPQEQEDMIAQMMGIASPKREVQPLNLIGQQANPTAMGRIGQYGFNYVP